jgi:hypothetical protein
MLKLWQFKILDFLLKNYGEILSAIPTVSLHFPFLLFPHTAASAIPSPRLVHSLGGYQYSYLESWNIIRT